MWVAVEIESDLLPLNHLFKTCAEITGCVGGSPHSPPSRITLSVDKHAIILYRELNNGRLRDLLDDEFASGDSNECFLTVFYQITWSTTTAHSLTTTSR